jgi:hypothetical protein
VLMTTGSTHGLGAAGGDDEDAAADEAPAAE